MQPSKNDYLLRSDDTVASGEGNAIGISEILGALRRRWRLLVLGCVSGLTLAVSYIVLATPLYTSTVRILIDTRMNQNLQTQKLVEETPVDTALVDSQVQILSSESIVLSVIKSMNLAHDREFVGPPDALGAKILWQIKKLMGIVEQALNLKDVSPVDAQTLLERTAVETFLERLTPKREDVTYVIDISFASEDPNKAARIANAIADTYIAANMEAKSTSTKMANQWLQDRLRELRVQTTDTDRILQNYKAANDIVDTGRGLLNNEQLSDLNTQLVYAKAATAEAKARLDRIRQITTEGVPDVTVTDALNNSVITRLRAQYLDLAARAADLSSSVGPGHSTVVKIHEQMDELRKSIRTEQQRIADAYASDYEIAKARERALADSLSRLVQEAGTSSQAQVTMRDLESSADTYRNLYNTFLQKFQETIQTQTIPVTDARIVTRASTPLHKSSPKSALALAASVVLGLFMGAGAAIARELSIDVFRTADDIEKATGIQCLGLLPIVTGNRKRALSLHASTRSRRTPSDATQSIEEFVLEAPYSRFAETLRNVNVAINTAQLARDVKVIGVVSSVANEGKTTVAANLGALKVASSGARTLVIDGDLHQRSLTAKLAPDAREGLIEALSDPSRLATLIYHRQRSGLDVLPCVLANRVPNAAELLGSPRMEEMLLAARKAYDYIIIELAPIVSVVDVKVIERFIDSFVFVVEWGRSKRSLVLEALSDAQIIRKRLAGIVLNKADPDALRSIEAYKGESFRNYYTE
jgi:polysaccharide biosynthesis transport protein